jgi:hypothetical protein
VAHEDSLGVAGEAAADLGGVVLVQGGEHAPSWWTRAKASKEGVQSLAWGILPVRTGCKTCRIEIAVSE